MTKHSEQRKSEKPEKPKCPRCGSAFGPDHKKCFPLFPHGTGRWAKKIKGKTHYFGSWDDPNGALETYLKQQDDLHAGRMPRADGDGLRLRELVNAFLASKRSDMESGRRSPRTFSEYHRLGGVLINEFGANRAVSDIRPTDFERLYNKLASKYGTNSVSKAVTNTRSVFKYGFDNELIDKPVKFGSKFKVASKTDRRIEKARNRQQHGKRMFDAAEVVAMLEKASVQVKAMILLGINGGLGNTDIASLHLSALDLDGGWLDYPRVKTGIERRIPLWKETVTALREVVACRREPHDEADSDILFVTKYGQRWVRYSVVEEKRFGKTTLKTKQDDAIAKETAKLLNGLKLKRQGVGFYALRHTFETIAGGSKDQVAVDAIMGHVDSSMAAEYREGIADDRLRAVADHVHDWLFATEVTK
ncbi:MAG: tyrosine-type recombinase/integrase [Candidatus Paceibacterota bacterium]